MGNCWAAQAKSSLSLEEVFPNGQSGIDNGLSGDLKKEFPNGQSGSGKLDEVFPNGQSGSDNGLSGGLKKEFPNWQSGSGNLDEVFPNGQILPTSNLRVYSFSELKAATRNFGPHTVVWEGVFGNVYKGEIGKGLAIAVKKLNFGWKPKKRTLTTRGRVRIAWRSEVNFLGRLSHPNLVKLLGYCWEEEEKNLFLVYEFMPKGSLQDSLFKINAIFSQQEILSWSIRLKIAIGAARSLAFLHSLENPIIYGDFKASNILLDSNYNVKVSDIGLGKIGSSDEDSDVKTQIIGSYGHAFRDYFGKRHVLHEKSDVYCFGVVLLEILSGRRAFDRNYPRAEQNLVEWAKPYLSNRRRAFRIMDPRLEGQFPPFQAAQLTFKCLESEPKIRPSMKEVLKTLELIESKTDSVPPSTSTPTVPFLHQ